MIHNTFYELTTMVKTVPLWESRVGECTVQRWVDGFD